MKKLTLLLLSVLYTAATTFASDFKSGDLFYNITGENSVAVTYQVERGWQQLPRTNHYLHPRNRYLQRHYLFRTSATQSDAQSTAYGFSFVVTNLNANSHYTYTFTVNGADSEVIETYSGTFDTTEETAFPETEQDN